jgi:type II secretory pathway predicted ATPase ExeA
MYNLFYQFNDRPFSLNPDPKYFYISRPHKRAILHLRVGFQKRDGVLVLTGDSDKGMGKTTLITHMLEQLDKNDNIVAFIENPPQKVRDLLPVVLSALHIPVTTNQPKALFEILHKFMREQARLNKKVLLVIDDAEKLSKSCLEFVRLLATLRDNKHGLSQIVLMGTKELDAALAENEDQELHEQIAISYAMQPLQDSDTREYIEHRLKVAGWNGDPVIDNDAFAAIHQATKGVPYAINWYCDRLLMLGMLRETHHIDKEHVASLTPEILAKLDKLETEQLNNPKRNSAPKAVAASSERLRNKRNKSAPQTENEFDLEPHIFNTPENKARPFITGHTMTTTLAVCLIASVSFFAFNKMSGHGPGPAEHKSAETTTHATAASHAEAGGHSGGHTAVVASAAGHGKDSGTDRYILEEMHVASGAHSKAEDGSDSSMQLLDIQGLLKNSSKSLTARINGQTFDSGDTEAWENVIGDSSEPASDGKAEAHATEPDAEPASRNLHGFASNT